MCGLEGALQEIRDKMDGLQTTAAQISSLEEDVRGLKGQRDMKASHTEELYNSMSEGACVATRVCALWMGSVAATACTSQSQNSSTN